MQDRLISGIEKPEDHFDRAIRPTSLADYIGQPVVREQMEIFIGAARGRGGHRDPELDAGDEAAEGIKHRKDSRRALPAGA